MGEKLRPFNVVAAVARDGAIGVGGALPWRLRGDLKWFADLTRGGVVMMGRRTFDSLGRKPLAGRLNVVLSRSATPSQLGDTKNTKQNEGLWWFSDFDTAHRAISDLSRVGAIFVIGGSDIFAEALGNPWCAGIYLTRVDGEFPEADTWFPKIDEREYWLRESGSRREEISGGMNLGYWFETYTRRRPNVEEAQYLALVREVMTSGEERVDRTGVGTWSRFGASMRFDLRGGRLPLLTTKRVWWRGIVEELLWFISGSTDAKALSARGVKIWEANGSREFLDGAGLRDNREGDLGPVYGFQWRHFGATYRGADVDYTGQGVDQLAECIRLIREDPNSRRIVMSAWNPAQLREVALPPCHMFCQFYVRSNEVGSRGDLNEVGSRGELSCQLYQRSGDLGLGVPFNIASYALLTHLVARVCGLEAVELIHVIGDAHVYRNHESGLREQLTRDPRPWPFVRIAARESIDNFTAGDIELIDYSSHPAINLPFAV
jgi:dihydrofolate reductase / thymidylate synthase